MALQDGLLSFTIKETIFLSSDRAGIGELQELELVPDVEVLENQSYVSITGCLQLFGKYEPIREPAEPTSGGTETLIEAMNFSPFRQDGGERSVYGWEEQIGHRIPLNITIPLERIAEMGDIYAVVDSVDFRLESPHQMLVEAELKIAGIQFTNQAESEPQKEMAVPYAEGYHAVPASQEDSWEFSHAAVEGDDVLEEPSLDEIEQKLSALEQEMERQAQTVSFESEESPSLYDAPAIPVSSHQTSRTESYGEVSEESLAEYESAQIESWQHVAQSQTQDSSAYEQVLAQEDYEERLAVDGPNKENEELVLAIHEPQEVQDVDFTSVSVEERTSSESNDESYEESYESQSVFANEEQESHELAVKSEEAVEDEELAEAAEVMANADVEEQEEEVEVRIAISGKPSREEAGNLNITSIFSNASRAKQDAEALQAESSSSSSKKASLQEANPSTLEAMQNLSSFVRSREERTSQLKLCIIQKEETLELISQRYSLPVSRLVEVNRLTTDQLVAGQILYIPQ